MSYEQKRKWKPQWVPTSVLRRQRRFWYRTQRKKLYKIQGGRCHYCGVLCAFGGNTPNSFTLDHIIPIVDYRKSSADNLIGSCKSCNEKKGSTWYCEYEINR